jgi:hypothetical protein
MANIKENITVEFFGGLIMRIKKERVLIARLIWLKLFENKK